MAEEISPPYEKESYTRQESPSSVAIQESPVSQPKADMIFCSKCGQKNHENNFKCVHCGFVLHNVPFPQYAIVSEDETVGRIIPYKNPQALWAYYLGIFSILPFVGILLGIAAIILGIRGLNHVNSNPNAHGKIHAWVGIILGALFAIGYTLLFTIPVMIGIFT